jgi:hypothetical protein
LFPDYHKNYLKSGPLFKDNLHFHNISDFLLNSAATTEGAFIPSFMKTEKLVEHILAGTLAPTHSFNRDVFTVYNNIQTLQS